MKFVVTVAAFLAVMAFNSGLAGADPGPVDASGRPLIIKEGTVDIGMVETTPVLFQGRVYRLEAVRADYWDNPTAQSCFRFVDRAAGRTTPPFGWGHVFASAFVEGDTVYVSATSSEEGWTGRKVQIFASKDLKTWESWPALDLEGFGICNTSICKAENQYVMMFEIHKPVAQAGVAFPARFATSKDLKHWELTPPECVYAKDRYTAPHCLRYLDGYYYDFYLEAHQGYETRVVRSKDLRQWEPSPLNPVLRASWDDRIVRNPKLTPTQRRSIATAVDLNNSDLDFCEHNGRLILNYSWGNQQGTEFLAEATYPGTLAQFLKGWFPEKMPAPSNDGTLRQRGISVLPRPATIEVGEDKFTLTPKTTVLVSPGTELIGGYLTKALVPATGYDLKLVPAAPGDAPAEVIQLSLAGEFSRFGDEGYELRVLADRVLIQAAKPAGVFYACQTLRQLLPAQIESRTNVPDAQWVMPVVRIEDRPQFVWRGILLDPARHFLSKPTLLKYLELMSYHKLNRLHLHLTDTDGWRVEIKQYPRLTEVGAWADLGAGVRLGGYYTQEDLKEIVAYATERFITIVPEIETPSHAGSAMAAYPELNCFGTRHTVYGWDPLCGSEFCPGNDQTLRFLDAVLTEIAQIFPGPYIHIGGDEAEMAYWGQCPKCQQRLKEEKLNGAGALHGWFMERVKRIVESKGRRIVGWGGVATGAVFTCWDWDGDEGWNAARSGWDVVMSTGANLYLDFDLDHTNLKDTYRFDPVPPRANLTPAQRQHILGLEGCLWGEAIPENHLDRQAFPRVLALAERGWGIDHYDFTDFLERVKLQVDRLALMGVVTGPAFPYEPVPALPARIRSSLPSLIYSEYQNQNDEDWRWKLTGFGGRSGKHEAFYPLNAFDGDPESFFTVWGPRKDVETFAIVLAQPAPYDQVKVITGLKNGELILRQGVLEVSSAYGRWQTVSLFTNGIASAKLDANPVASVRIRSTTDQSPYDLMAIREIILQKDGYTTLQTLSPVERLRLPGVAPAK